MVRKRKIRIRFCFTKIALNILLSSSYHFYKKKVRTFKAIFVNLRGRGERKEDFHFFEVVPVCARANYGDGGGGWLFRSNKLLELAAVEDGALRNFLLIS